LAGHSFFGGFPKLPFKLHKDEYAKLEDPPQQPSNLLLPPTREEKLAEVGERLGPLQADLWQMVQIANGLIRVHLSQRCLLVQSFTPSIWTYIVVPEVLGGIFPPRCARAKVGVMQPGDIHLSLV
jgi:hypothetical protein